MAQGVEKRLDLSISYQGHYFHNKELSDAVGLKYEKQERPEHH